jgi:hypothetical protein
MTRVGEYDAHWGVLEDGFVFGVIAVEFKGSGHFYRPAWYSVHVHPIVQPLGRVALVNGS